MLEQKDVKWLMQELAATAEMLDKAITPPVVMMMAKDLECYPKEVLAAALARVRSEHTGRLTPKSIIERIDAVTGRPGANEAWATALTALDERNTVVWTGEMMQAWEAARPVARAGDLIGARMTFIGAYERLCRAARDQRRMPEITVSEGWDTALRAGAVEKAVSLGYVPADSALALAYVPAQAPVIDVLALANGVYEASPSAQSAPPAVREKFRELKASLLASNRRDAEEKARKRVAAAADLAARKAAAHQMATSHPEYVIDPAAMLLRAEWAAAGKGVAA